MAINHYLEDERINIARGVTVKTSSIHKFGAVPAMSQSKTGTIWDVNDTKYPWHVWDSSPGPVQVLAADAADSGKSITIEGLDSNYEAVSDTITFTSLADTSTTESYRRVFRAYLTNGSADNEDVINIKKDGVVVARINADNSQTLMTVYTVPAGKTGYLMKGSATAQASADGNGRMMIRYYGNDAFRVGHSFEVAGAGGQYTYDFAVPIQIPEKSDIDVRLTTRTNNGRFTSAFDMILIDD